MAHNILLWNIDRSLTKLTELFEHANKHHEKYTIITIQDAPNVDQIDIMCERIAVENVCFKTETRPIRANAPISDQRITAHGTTRLITLVHNTRAKVTKTNTVGNATAAGQVTEVKLQPIGQAKDGQERETASWMEIVIVNSYIRPTATRNDTAQLLNMIQLNNKKFSKTLILSDVNASSPT